jgi:RND family efflux transporter MFP subunit
MVKQDNFTRAFLAMMVIVLLAGCAMLPATRSEQVASEATPTPIPTAQIALKPTYTVQQGDVVKTTTFAGRISPVVEEELFFRADGRVRSVFFRRNEPVKKDDVIAELEIDALERELVAANLELERAQTVLTEAERALEFDRRAAEIRLEMEKARLDGVKRDPNSTRADEAAQEMAVQMAQLDLERLGADVSPLLRGDVTRAQYAVEKLTEEIAESQITAPFDGLILSLTLSPGQAVQAYQPVVTLADPATLEVSANILGDQLQLLAEEMPVTMILSSRPGQLLHGVVRRLPYPFGSGGSGQTIEEKDKSTRVTIEESAADAGYALGDLVRVTAEVERRDNVVWIPPQAVRNFNGRRFAVVQDGDVQRRVDVKIGVQGEERVEIEEGLEVGQTVVGP